MSSLQERIEILERDLLATPPRISAYHDLPFAILRYEPASEFEARKQISLFATRLQNAGKRIHFISIPSADSWAKTLGQGRADITPNLLSERAFELASRRRPGHALIFIIDEVGQYVSRSVDKMLDLQAVVQAFGREGKNRVSRRQALGRGASGRGSVGERESEKDREPSDEAAREAARAAADLREAMESELFSEHLDTIRQDTELLRGQYLDLYSKFHQQRFTVYSAAIDEIKGLPEWAQVEAWERGSGGERESGGVGERERERVGVWESGIVGEWESESIGERERGKERQRRLDSVQRQLLAKLCEKPDMADDSHVCSGCRATIGQIESEIAAVDVFKVSAIRELQELATPEKKIVRVRASSILGTIVETPKDIDDAIERLKEHLLKLLAEGTRIVLE